MDVPFLLSKAQMRRIEPFFPLSHGVPWHQPCCRRQCAGPARFSGYHGRRKLPSVVKGSMLKDRGMPQFDDLSDAELAAVRHYIRNRAADLRSGR